MQEEGEGGGSMHMYSVPQVLIQYFDGEWATKQQSTLCFEQQKAWVELRWSAVASLHPRGSIESLALYCLLIVPGKCCCCILREEVALRTSLGASNQLGCKNYYKSQITFAGYFKPYLSTGILPCLRHRSRNGVTQYFITK